MNGKPTNFELLDPPSPDALVPDPIIGFWIVVGLILVLLVISIILIIRRKKNAAPNPLAARNAAYREAVSALEKMNALQSRDAAVQSSLILRKYLSLAANDPALFETHEEFISRHDALNALTEEARKASQSGFTRLASQKYGAEIPEVNPLDVVNESRALLETLHHGFHA
ncbi:MAG: hypothetical protein ABI162_17700 [Luteolibacter sp.]